MARDSAVLAPHMKIGKRAIVFLLVVAAVSATILHYANRGPRAAPGTAVPELISLAPADSAYLLYADLSTLRASPFLTRLMALAPVPATDPDYAKFVRATGFDYTQDLDRLVLAARPGSPSPLTLALAEGRFDRAKISSYALRSGGLERHSGAEVYVFPPSPTSKAMSMAFLDPNRVAMAEGPEATAVVAALASHGAPSAFAPAVRERISRLADSAVFAVGQVNDVPENLSVGGLRSDQFSNLVRSLRWFTLVARPEVDRLKIAVEGECNTVENARQLAATLDGLRLFGQAAIADPKLRRNLEPSAVSLLENLLRRTQISRDDQRVRLSLELTSEMVNRLPGAPARKIPATSPRMR